MDLPADPLARAIFEAVAQVARKAGRGRPVFDRRLASAALDLARASRGVDLPLGTELPAFLLQHHGLVESEPGWFFLHPRNEGEALQDARSQLTKVVDQISFDRVAVAVDRGPKNLTVLLAFQEQLLVLRPVARLLAAGGAAAINGKFLGAHRQPEVLVTTPRGNVVPLHVRSSSGADFFVTFLCQDDGAYQVEIAGTDHRGLGILANFPLYCGVGPPGPPQVIDAAQAVGGRIDAAAVEHEIFVRINRDRAAAGLTPVAADARLVTVARAHSADMAGADYVAHISPRTGNAVQRLAKIGLAPRGVWENVARNYSAGDVQRGLMRSPAHRANILAAAATHVGIGVAIGKGIGVAVPIYCTQLFATDF